MLLLMCSLHSKYCDTTTSSVGVLRRSRSLTDRIIRLMETLHLRCTVTVPTTFLSCWGNRSRHQPKTRIEPQRPSGFKRRLLRLWKQRISVVFLVKGGTNDKMSSCRKRKLEGTFQVLFTVWKTKVSSEFYLTVEISLKRTQIPKKV